MDTGQSGNTAPFRGVAAAVLGAVASGIGVVGFLIFVGGAVQAARDRGVGLSAPFAVPLVPRTQLLTSGADQLFAPFVLTLGIVGVAVIYVMAKRQLPDQVDRWLRWTLLLGGVLAAILVFRHQAGDPTPAPFGTGDREVAFTGAILVLTFGVYLASRLALTVRGEQGFGGSPQLLGFIGVVAATAVTYGALVTFARNEWRPEVHPIALVGHTYPAGLTGVYVGEDSSYVYVGVIYAALGNIGSNRLKARVIEVNRSDITALAVGGLFTLTNFPHDRQHPLTEHEKKVEVEAKAQLEVAEQGLLRELRAGRE
jgi:hypothetical protein